MQCFISFGIVHKCNEIHGLGCVNQAGTRVRVTQPSPHIFLHICILSEAQHWPELVRFALLFVCYLLWTNNCRGGSILQYHGIAVCKEYLNETSFFQVLQHSTTTNLPMASHSLRRFHLVEILFTSLLIRIRTAWMSDTYNYHRILVFPPLLVLT